MPILTALANNLLPTGNALAIAEEQAALWEKWLLPVSEENPLGEDPAYHDDFQSMREEVNKLSGSDTQRVCQLAQTLLIDCGKDVRVATYYLWARTWQDGDAGLADGLALLSGLLARYGEKLLPTRAQSRKVALEWLAASKMQDALARHPEVALPDFARAVAALSWMQASLRQWPESSRPCLDPLTGMLETRLARAGGANALVPQQAVSGEESDTAATAPVKNIQSGRDLLEQGKALAEYLHEQPQGGLASARLMRVLRWDTVYQLPPKDDKGNTRLLPPRGELRGKLKRLYAQQNWLELLDKAASIFTLGVNHFWLDLQWYSCQALKHAGQPYADWEEVIAQDLRLLLLRLPGLELQSYNDGTPFADEATRIWIEQLVNENATGWSPLPGNATSDSSNDILALESETLAQADSDGIEVAFNWLLQVPGIHSLRQRWLQRLLMARVAEQCGKNEMACCLLAELNQTPAQLSLADWEPELLFEVRARLLKQLRLRQQRNDGDKQQIQQQMETLLAGLVAIDPARAAVLC